MAVGSFTHAGTRRNYRVVGLTARNTVVCESDVHGGAYDSHEPPSNFYGMPHYTPAENRILRRGITPAGRDRAAPVGEVVEDFLL